jgi:hypothetical protein
MKGEDGCAVLFNSDTTDMARINAVGAAVWGLVNGRRSLGDILRTVSRRFASVPDAALDDVTAFVDDLAARGFVGYELEDLSTVEMFTPGQRSREGTAGPTDSGALYPAGRETGDVLLFAHRGSSMNPTLHESDLLEIAPYGEQTVRVGDVIVVAPPDGEHLVVHRVVRVAPEGVCTRGDNNPGNDGWCLRRDQVIGRAVAARRGRKRRRIRGGGTGRAWARLLYWRRSCNRAASALLRPVYRGLARSEIVRRLAPPFLRPRLIVFRAGEGSRLRLLLGRRIVGQYEAGGGRWRIRRPFRLFVDERALPGGGEEGQAVHAAG